MKCLYRRAQALKSIADAISDNSVENLKIKYDKYERARKDLEKVNLIDSTNKLSKEML